VGDAYAVDGFEPELAFDFTGETYRTDGSATTFSGAMTHSATSLGTMVDGDGPELVKNGTFDTDLRNWTDYSEAGGSIAWNASGIALTTGVDGTQEGRAYQIITTEVGKVYQVTATRSGAASRFDISSSGPASADLYISSTSTTDISTFIVATSTTTYLNLRNLTSYNDTAYIDNISVREVPAIKWRPHNLLTYSEDFSNASWSKTNSTISSNVTTSPSGTLSADKIIPANLATNGNTAKSVSVSAATYTLSFYAKADDQSVVSFVSNMSGTFRANIFNLSTGVATQATDWEAKMIDVGNGWWRCIATAVAASASSYTFQIGNNSTGWTGDGTSGVYIWGAHLYRSDLGGMVDNPDRGDSYVPTAVRVLPSAPELVTNGHFNYGIDGWTDGNTEGTIAWNASGYMDLARNGGTGGGVATQSITTTSGKYYLVTFDIISLSNGIRVYFGTPASGTFTTTGTKTFLTTADASSELLRFDLMNSTTATATIDNVSVKESYISPGVARYLPRRGHYVYNDQAWTNRGLLLESEARTNLLTYSEDFTNVAWAKTNTTITANSINSPDGSTNGSLADATTTVNGISKTATIVADSTNTCSFYVKYNSAQWIRIVLYEAATTTNRVTLWVDILNGVLGSATSGGTGSGAVGNIENVGNGWYRLSLSGAVNNSATSVVVQISNASSDGVTTGTTDDYYIWGAQLEEGSTPSSYMPTNGATFTRAVETLTVAAADLPSTITPIVRRAALVTAGWTITDGGAV
jgi:hypothetical protein